jgi:hypothetical protein
MFACGDINKNGGTECRSNSTFFLANCGRKLDPNSIFSRVSVTIEGGFGFEIAFIDHFNT